MLVIVACTEPERTGIEVQSQGCETRPIEVAGTWLRVAVDVVDIICVWMC